MKRTWLRAGTLTVAMMFAAGSAFAQSTAGQGTQGQGSQGTKPTGAKSQGSQQGSAAQKQFVQKMMMSNITEIQMGKLGSEKASSDEVKKFAQMMVEHHTQANEELMPLVKQHGLEQTDKLDAKHQAVATRLSKLEGAAFDREFMTAMVTSHRETVQQVRPMAGATGTTGKATASGTAGTSGGGTASGGASSGGTVQDPKQYAAKTLPIIQQHLQQAQQIQKSLTKSK